MSPTGSLNHRGFTLLELVLVMAIIGLAVALVAPRLESGDRTFQAQIREMRAVLEYARRSAVISGQPRTATFHLPLSQGEKPTANTTPKRRSSTMWLSDQTTLRWGTKGDLRPADSREEPVFTVLFFPEGGSTGGELIISAGERRSARISINPITGRVAIGTERI